MLITRIVNSVFESNSFILTKRDCNAVWLVDIGDIDPILNSLAANQTIKGLFITHTHYDHIYGIRQLIDLFPDCKVYTSENGRKGLLSDQYNFSRYHNDPIKFDHPNITELKGDDTVSLIDNYIITAYETPGHDWSCLSYKLSNNMLFTGDSYIPGLKVVTSFPKSSKVDSEKAIKKIKSLITPSTKIYPGHGEVTSINSPNSYNATA